MTLCHSSPVLPLVRALIIVSPLLSLLSLTICFFRISCHCIWSISLLHTIPIERCASLYVIVTDAPMSFSTLFIYSLVEVHRRIAKSRGLFFLVFIHRILLDLGLKNFPAFEPVHIIAPIGATFLRQRASQLKASSKLSRVESSIGDGSWPPPSSDPFAEAYVYPTTNMDPPPSTSSNSSLCSMLNTVMTVQAHMDSFCWICSMSFMLCKHIDARGSTPQAPPFDESWLPFGNSSQKGRVHIQR